MGNRMKNLLLITISFILSGCCSGMAGFATAENNYCQGNLKSVESIMKENEERKFQQDAVKEYGGTVENAIAKKKEENEKKIALHFQELRKQKEENLKARNEYITKVLGIQNKILTYQSDGYIIALYNKPCKLRTVEAPLMFKAIVISGPMTSRSCWGETLNGMIKITNVWESSEISRAIGAYYQPEVESQLFPKWQFSPSIVTKDGIKRAN